MSILASVLITYVPYIIIGIVVFFILCLMIAGYVKASPDRAYIISGLRKSPKVLIGRAGIKIPFLEKKDELNLQLIPIDVKTSNSVPTADYININVDAAVNIKVSADKVRLQLAAQNFLNKTTDYIAAVAREVLEGNMREIVGKMNLEEMVSDRQKFAELVKENAEPDLAAMGLDIVSFNVQNFVDENGVIENLGVDNIVKIQKNAAISRAESEKEIAKAKAMARKEANDAEVSSDLEIANAQAEAQKRKAIVQANANRESQEAQIEADTKQASADAAYSIQQETERKKVEIATADANLARQEKAIALKEKEVELTERTLEATVKKQAEAEKYAKQQEADAKLYETQRQSEAQLFERQKNAEADKFEQEKKAEAEKATADANRYTMEQEAEGIRSKGQAEADAIRAKALAEAEGIEKKAEAMKQMGEAAVLEMYFKAMPEIAKNIAEPLAKVDKITMYGDGNSSKLMKDIMNTLNQVTDGMKESTGIDLGSVLAGFAGAKIAEKKDYKEQ